MTKADKLLEKMLNNPRDWQIADLETIAVRLGVIVRKGKGSHVSFTHSKCIEILTVPAHRPIKPIYVKKFLAFINAMQEEKV